MQLQIIFENQDWVVVDKPGGVLSVPARFSDDPRPVLGHLLQAQLKQQIFPVHRLDFEVSGLIMFAKNANAHRLGNSWFENKKVTKTYFAWTEGEWVGEHKGQWQCKILRGKKRAYESPVGKDSLTSFEFLGKSPQGLLQWHLNPITGRSHQLRYEMYRHQCPIVGDTLYGAKQTLADGAIGLRAFRLDLTAVGLPLIEVPKLIP